MPPWNFKVLRTPPCYRTYLFILYISLLLFDLTFASGVSSIEVSSTAFSNLPTRLFYLDNSEVIFYQEVSTNVVWRSADEGATWSKVSDLPKSIVLFTAHPHFNSVVIALTSDKKHYITTDQGKSWKSFETPHPPATDSEKPILAFHATRPDDYIILLSDCGESNHRCVKSAYYTKDSFSTIHKLIDSANECIWAHSTKHFDSTPTDMIFCLEVSGSHHMMHPDDLRLVSSEDFFQDSTTRNIVYLGGGSPVGFGIVEEFLVVAVKARMTDLIEMWVSMDGLKFAPAQFPDASTKREAYTILESSQFSLTIDIALKSSNGLTLAPYGSIYSSNSNGTYFKLTLDHTNRNNDGHVDFERIQAPMYEGIMLANVVDNWEELEILPGIIADYLKNIVTKISFDNGNTWRVLVPPEKDSEGKEYDDCKKPKECALHLSSVTRPHNVGRVFSSAGAPGFVLGVGNVGSKLASYEKGNTFLSVDGGLTWKEVAKGPHKYETLDQGSVIVLIPDSEDVDYILFSDNQGRKFQKYQPEFPNVSSKWAVRLTNVDNDSTSRKMTALITDKSGNKHHMVQINFAKYFSTQCTTSDFELWKPKHRLEGPDCMMGHETGYQRRKPESQCYVGKKFEQPKVTIKPCECTRRDFECDFNYALKDDKCVAVGFVNDQPEDCPEGKTYMGKSGYIKIPGNQCEKGLDLEKHVEKQCKSKSDLPRVPSIPDNTGSGGRLVQPPGNRHPIAKLKTFNDKVDRIMYIEKTSTVFIRTVSGDIYRSPDEGATWVQPAAIKSKGPVLRMGVHETIPKRIFFVMKRDDKIYVTDDALEGMKDEDDENPPAKTFRELKTPVRYNTLGVSIIDFHPEEPEWLVFVGGGRSCPDLSDCYTKTWISFDNGKDWTGPIDTWATKCLWGRDSKFLNKVPKDSVFCISYKNKRGNIGQDVLGGKSREDNPLQLVAITNRGRDKKVVIDKGVVNFFVVDHVMVVAVENDGVLKLLVSLDGSKFTEAVFPPNIKVEKSAFTMLQSTTGGIFMDVGQNDERNTEYGSLFVSGEDGVYFSRSLQYTNRDSQGYVDFSKVQGIDGIAVANQVANVADLGSGRGSSTVKKMIRSVISFDDGSTWKSISAPYTDALGKEISCKNDCSLHLYSHANGQTPATTLHSYPEAVGLMIAVGNVGTHLLDYNEGNVYISRNAGQSWVEVHKDAHKWAVGDHGSLIVLVNDEGPTDRVVYSWDFGTSWAEYRISESPIRVHSLVSIPSSTKFVIMGSYVGKSTSNSRRSEEQVVESTDIISTGILEPRSIFTSGASDTVLMHLDFTKLFESKCKLDKSNAAKSDFETWSPRGREGSRCFLGREVEYTRRKQDRLCFVGMEWEQLSQREEVCQCTEHDFFCDVHFWRDEHGKCVLYGLDPKQPKNCKTGSTFKGTSGYRKIGLSKCTGGVNLEKEAPERVCGDPSSGGSPGSVAVTFKEFDDQLVDYKYFNNSHSVVFTDAGGRAWVSLNEGKDWEKAVTVDSLMDKVIALISDPYRESRAYMMTLGKTLWVTDDKAKKWSKITTPSPPNHFNVPALSIHPTKPDWLLWIGDAGCGDDSKGDCRTQAYYSANHGRSWNLVRQYVLACQWGRTEKFIKTHEDSIYCLSFKEKKGDMQLLLAVNDESNPVVFEHTQNWGKEWTSVFERGLGFTTAEEFMVYAMLRPDSKELEMQVSLDGKEWSKAVWPPNFRVPDYGYTVLQSTTGRLFVDVNTEIKKSREQLIPVWGALFRSNSNGTFFTLSIDHTNRDDKGYVDFEKMQSIEGIVLVNQIQNPKEVSLGSAKEIRTKISMNDGATWSDLVPPNVDSSGSTYKCGDKCFLNLHAYTERQDRRDQYSSSSAPGLMVAVGNVGEYLSDYKLGDMFLTRDAGNTWKEIAKEAHMYEFGDHGGILVMLNNEEPTDVIKYSLNEGQTFSDLKLTDYTGGEKLRVTNIITEPSGTTAYFVIFGTIRDSGGSRGTKSVAITLDFSSTFPRNCELNLEDSAASDYEVFSPKLTNGDDSEIGCLFGQKVSYYIRKQDRECRIKQEFRAPIEKAEPCKCVHADYECDYNYYYDAKSKKCILHSGLQKPKPTCHPDGKLRETTGYIKSPHSKCVGGVDLDNGPVVGSCKGGISFGGWFGIITATFGITGIVTWCFTNYRKRGRIALPTDDLLRSTNSDSYIEKATLVFHTVVLYSLEAAEWVAERIKRAYDAAVIAVQNRRRGDAGGIWSEPFDTGFPRFSRGNNGYVPVTSDEAAAAFNPMDPNDASLLLLDDDDEE